MMDQDPSNGFSVSPRGLTQRPSELQCQNGHGPAGVERKARQAAKIRELWESVRTAGFLTVDEQAKALGLSRSTAWTLRKANHKSSGLSVSIINQMLSAPHLPPLARAKILEYIQEKADGLYGGSESQRRRFVARVKDIERSVYQES
jgi:predicted DNA-binding transcriptional regulator AlpA